jgi:hypothetical protein
MDYKKEKENINIIQNYNRECMKLINIAENFLDDDPTFDWFIRMIKIVKNENPSMLIERSLDKLWNCKDNILNKNDKFFTDNTKMLQLEYIKNDKNKEWLTEFTSAVSTKMHELSIVEKDIMWECLKKMLECSIQYKLLHNTL